MVTDKHESALEAGIKKPAEAGSFVPLQQCVKHLFVDDPAALAKANETEDQESKQAKRNRAHGWHGHRRSWRNKPYHHTHSSLSSHNKSAASEQRDYRSRSTAPRWRGQCRSNGAGRRSSSRSYYDWRDTRCAVEAASSWRRERNRQPTGRRCTACSEGHR